MIIKQSILMGMVLFGLGGCANYHPSFECKPWKGIACSSVSQVNAMVDNGSWKHKVSDKNNKEVKKETIRVKNQVPFPIVVPNNLDESAVFRVPEETLRIWVAPYVSEDDGYMDSQYIHQVVEPGEWLEDRS